MSLQFTTVAVAIKVTVPVEALQRHLAASPSVVTDELVKQVLQYEHQQQLGYFPALDYYIQHKAIDSDLVDALQNISWVVSNMVRNEIRIKIRPVFSTIKFQSIQLLANTLPTVRTSDPNITNKLTEHFSLTNVKVNLMATLIQKFADNEASEARAKSLMYQWLKSSFDSIEVTSSKVVS